MTRTPAQKAWDTRKKRYGQSGSKSKKGGSKKKAKQQVGYAVRYNFGKGDKGWVTDSHPRKAAVYPKKKEAQVLKREMTEKYFNKFQGIDPRWPKSRKDVAPAFTVVKVKVDPKKHEVRKKASRIWT